MMETSKLSGVPLCLAVASVLGKEAFTGKDGECWVRTRGRLHPWRPDLGGQAGADVFDYAVSNSDVSLETTTKGKSKVYLREPDNDIVNGETHWVAICRAIAASVGAK